MVGISVVTHNMVRFEVWAFIVTSMAGLGLGVGLGLGLGIGLGLDLWIRIRIRVSVRVRVRDRPVDKDCIRVVLTTQSGMYFKCESKSI